MAKTTASASGTKRNLATPERKKIGTKTMQMQRVETKAGTAIWAAPFRMHSSIVPPSAMLRWIFSISTVASSTRIPTAKAIPPKVMILIVSPRALSTTIEQRIERGIDTQIIKVLRQLLRKNRIIKAVKHAAMMASRSTPWIEALTKIDWSVSKLK